MVLTNESEHVHRERDRCRRAGANITSGEAPWGQVALAVFVITIRA